MFDLYLYHLHLAERCRSDDSVPNIPVSYSGVTIHVVPKCLDLSWIRCRSVLGAGAEVYRAGPKCLVAEVSGNPTRHRGQQETGIFETESPLRQRSGIGPGMNDETEKFSGVV